MIHTLKKYSALIFFALFLLMVAFYLASQRELAYFKENPREVIREEIQQDVQELVREVGALIVLPADETPTIATVSKPEALKDQPFFANAELGFKVLIFPVAKKAILYNPVAKRIVEVAPVNIGEAGQKAPATAPKK